MNDIKYNIKNLQQTKDLAILIAKNLKVGDVIMLKGGLGAGKTTFTRYLINYFYDDEIIINSPTFNIVQTYETCKFTIWHFDLYRIKNIGEIYQIGIEQALDEGVSIIEWPEMIEDNISDKLVIDIDYRENNRIFNILLSNRWNKNLFV